MHQLNAIDWGPHIVALNHINNILKPMVTWRSPISRKVRMFFAYGYMVFEPVHVLVLQWPAKGSKFQQFLRK